MLQHLCLMKSSAWGAPTTALDENDGFLLSRTMVAVKYSTGIVVAINTYNCICYYMHNKIFCYGASQGRDRDILLSTATSLEELKHSKGCEITLAKTLQLLGQKYKAYRNVNVLVAGLDRTGLHLYKINAGGLPVEVSFAAKGSGISTALRHLSRHWHKGITRQEAENMATDAIKLSDGVEGTDGMPALRIELCHIQRTI